MQHSTIISLLQLQRENSSPTSRTHVYPLLCWVLDTSSWIWVPQRSERTAESGCWQGTRSPPCWSSCKAKFTKEFGEFVRFRLSVRFVCSKGQISFHRLVFDSFTGDSVLFTWQNPSLHMFGLTECVSTAGFVIRSIREPKSLRSVGPNVGKVGDNHWETDASRVERSSPAQMQTQSNLWAHLTFSVPAWGHVLLREHITDPEENFCRALLRIYSARSLRFWGGGDSRTPSCVSAPDHQTCERTWSTRFNYDESLDLFLSASDPLPLKQESWLFLFPYTL